MAYKKEICPKCNQLRYPHHHHILPKILFGKIGFISKMCHDYHIDYHKDLGRKALFATNLPASYYIKHFIKWMATVIIVYFLIQLI